MQNPTVLPVLNEPTAAAGASPAVVSGVEAELRRVVEGEVRFDQASRLLYATDASLWQIVPIGVVIPRTERDVVETVRIAAKRQVPLLPRGSGTSLAGQSVGCALVLDFTKYLNQVLEVNAEERWVRVQPGVILDELNAQLKPLGLKFAPDVAPSNRASVGGMMGNNSCGAHSILYGKTIDHVLQQRVILSDGSEAHFGPCTEEEWRERAAAETLEGQIYRETERICRDNAAEIEARFPRIMRRVGGYNVDEIVRRRNLNLASIMVGSEGTLATVVEAKLRLVPLPRHTALLISRFDDLLDSLRAVQTIIKHGPAAVELMDRIVLDLTRENIELRGKLNLPEITPEAELMTEFYGETAEAAAAKMEALAAELTALGMGTEHNRITDLAAQAQIWSVRKAGVGLLMGMKGEARPAGFIEDSAVPTDVLPEFIRDLRALLGEYRLEACYYAHASVGLLHVRPILNLKKAVDREHMREIASRTADLVLHYGGAMSAEHGDGLARSEWQERMYGPQIYQAFRELKAAFDPQGIMNPGKIVDAPRMNENLRYRDGYQTIPVDTVLDFSRDGGFGLAVEMCSGVGACRKKLEGAMCPSYRATLEEEHSTRGRANLLRMAISGQTGRPDFADPVVREALDLCLECKACKAECPSNVDMAKLKYEFLHHYHQAHGTPERARFFGRVAEMSRLGSHFPWLANWIQSLPFTRQWMERRLGIDSRRPLPALAPRTLLAWFKSHQVDARAGQRGEVLLLADTFTNYQEPEVGQAAVRVLEACGYRVRIPELRCCGRPQISKGLLEEARANAEYNVRTLHENGRGELPLIGLEPSCLVTFRDEYRDFRLGHAAEGVAERSFLFEDLLARIEEPLPFREDRRRVLLHGHCHQKAVLGMKGPMALLKRVPGFEVTLLNSGCCGMAGTFGYEKEHYDLSLKIGELTVLRQVREAPEDALIVAAGTSCRHQIRHATGRTALHPAQALEAVLAPQ
jgi:FAD/FMN-containing dehydrogenase/Fe-S oxidoreductase